VSPLKVAVVGATGAVGREMWRLLEASDLPVSDVIPYPSPRSRGKRLAFRGAEIACRDLGTDTLEPVHLALFSAGAKVSREWSPRFADAGAVVVDNSSAFRADPACPLVVPEVNGHLLDGRAAIIANPNCSTIQMVVALAPLHATWGLEAVRVSTYQSVSGAGARAMDELLEATRAHLAGSAEPREVFPHPIAFNVVPHVGTLGEAGESEEEAKMRTETRRILDLPDLPVSATCVRVPVFRGHSESVWASFRETPDPARARHLLAAAGLLVEDEPARAHYPLARNAAGRPEVFVGRIRRDPADSRGLVLWVVSDNLLKGAATNAFQIAETLVQRGLLPAAVA
jgi:aspartate-semialdehyde dehydrogenase